MASTHARKIARWNSKISRQWAKCQTRVDRYKECILKTKAKLVDGRIGNHVYVCEAGAAAVPYLNYRCTRYSIDLNFDAIADGTDAVFHVDNIEHVAARVVGDVSLVRMTAENLTPSNTDGAIEKFIDDMDDYDTSAHGSTGIRQSYHVRDMLVDVWQQMHIPVPQLLEGAFCLARLTEHEPVSEILIPRQCWQNIDMPLASLHT
jgi:hypothetical protein